MAHTAIVERSSTEVVAAVWSALVGRGYHLERSFDLQDAVAHHPADCGCPYHGTGACTCQYVVLLAYPPAARPAPPHVFTFHANGHTTWVTLHPDKSIGPGETRALLSMLAETALKPEPAAP